MKPYDTTVDKIEVNIDVGSGSIMCAFLITIGMICFGSGRCSTFDSDTPSEETSPPMVEDSKGA